MGRSGRPSAKPVLEGGGMGRMNGSVRGAHSQMLWTKVGRGCLHLVVEVITSIGLPTPDRYSPN